MNSSHLFLFLGCLLLVVWFLNSYVFQRKRLPRNALLNDIPAKAAVELLRASPEKDVPFAISRAFSFNDDPASEKIYEAYHAFYERKKQELTALLGPPAFEGSWMTEGYPVWAFGEIIAVWGADEDAIYLRLHHEDQDVPLEVALLSRRSPSSNHAPTSVYEELRKLAREHPAPHAAK